MKRREMRVTRGKDTYAFSAGEIVEALQGAGVLTDEAIRLAREVEKHYRSKDQRSVDLEALLTRIEGLVRERVSSEVADRFRAQTPPFVPIRVDNGDGLETFSRRTLSHSLEKLELSFKEAYALAKGVEQGLRTEGYETIAEAELAHMVALALEARYGRELRLKYEAAVSGAVDIFVVEADKSRLPYSRGILARSLMSVGLGPELSHNLAKRVEDVLWRSGERNIERRLVRREVVRLLNEEAGEEFARRYELLHSLRRYERPVIVLIGGAPGVGKSTLASELGYRLGVPRIVSTDAVRQALRSLISEELSPVLHSSSYTAWRAELLPGERDRAKPKRKRVIRGFQAQVQQLGTALAAIVERSIDEASSMVMEGIHLVPGISPHHEFDGALVVELVVAVSDEKSHQNHFGLRERQTQQRRQRDTYLEHFEEIRILQRFITSRAEEEGVPVIDATDFDQAVDKAMEHVLAALLVARLPEGERPRPAGAVERIETP